MSVDLIKHIKLGFNFATSMVDPEQDFLPYWGIVYDGKNSLVHGRIDNCDPPFCWMEIILLNRKLTGTRQAEEVEKGLRKWCQTDFHPDGLRYPSHKSGSKHVYCFLHGLAYVLDAMVSWYELTKENWVKTKIDSMIAGLRRIASEANFYADLTQEEDLCGGGLYFPFNNYVPEKIWDPNKYSQINCYELASSGTFILPLTRYYEITGDEKAKEFAEGLTKYILTQSYLYGFDGRFIGHFHRNMWSIVGILKYAHLVNNEEYFQRARQIYQFAEGLGSNFGWFPEMVALKDPSLEYCETCCIYDMIYGALVLAQAGSDEHWDRVSRYTKNHLLKSQFQNTSMIEDHDLAEKLLGGFSGWTQVNDYFTRDGKIFICGCCSWHGIKALHYIWEAITQRTNNSIYINLLLDKEDNDVIIRTSLPEKGQIEIELKHPAELYLRIPIWARNDLVAKYNGRIVSPEWKESYLRFKDVKLGDKIQVNFSVPEYREKVKISGREFLVEWLGDMVMQIEPKGKFLPLY